MRSSSATRRHSGRSAEARADLASTSISVSCLSDGLFYGLTLRAHANGRSGPCVSLRLRAVFGTRGITERGLGLKDVTIEPETKDWTWVLARECPECGFDTRSFRSVDIGRLSRLAAEPWPALLAHPLVHVRPDESRWSALEYGCHVRDVFKLGAYRVERMLREDDPRFDNWDQDATAVAERYDLQDPLTVAAEILTDADALANLYSAVTPEQWSRPSLRSDGSPFTVESFGRYFLHDPMHHIVDVHRGFDVLSGQPGTA